MRSVKKGEAISNVLHGAERATLTTQPHVAWSLSFDHSFATLDTCGGGEVESVPNATTNGGCGTIPVNDLFTQNTIFNKKTTQ